MIKRFVPLMLLCFFSLSLIANGGNDPVVTLCSGQKMSWKDYQLYKKLRSDDYDTELESMSNNDFVPFEMSTVNNTSGAWSSVIQMPLVTAAAANLPDGRIMTWSAKDKLSFGGNLGRTWTAIFDPSSNTAADILIQETQHDMFCPGTSTLPDGRIIISGGSSSNRTTIYDPATGSWNGGDLMNIARGYHSNVTLASGATFVIGGSWSGAIGGKDAEVWTEKTGWYLLPDVPVSTITEGIVSNQPERHDDYFPWLFPAPNGQLFHAGPSEQMHYIDPSGVGSVTSAGTRGTDSYAISGTAVMFDVGKILTAGGSFTFEENTAASNRSHVIDINGNSPNVSETSNLNFARNYHSSVVLPNGEVMVIGGIPISDVFSDDNSVLVPEIWNPNSGQWTQVATMAVPRNYHSVSILMLDGRVFTSGGGLCGSCNTNHPDAEIYSPAYLFNQNGSLATRPVINSAPSTANWNSSITVSANSTISNFSLVRMSATTHSTNNDLRRIPLQKTNLGNNQYNLAISNRNILPPGSYMLFAMNNNGTPSVAKIIKIGDDINDCTPTNNPNLGGTGLEGKYYSNLNFNSLALTRTDATIDFNWGTGAPAPSVGNETFSVRWTGQIEVPRNGTYSFYTNTDDGVRLWINGRQMVDNWTDHGTTEDIGLITLNAGQRYDIRLEYYEQAGAAVMQLRWSGPGINKEIIPAQNLFPPNPCGSNTGPCNNGDPCTINDNYDINCNCVGTLLDDDNDGICNANDQCPGFNDSLIGTSCDDGNPNTTNDIYQSDCNCAGTPSGGTPDCNDIGITTSPGAIVVSAVDGAPISSVQIFSSSWATIYICFADCNSPIETVNVPNGDYFVFVKYYTANYNLICSKDGSFTVGGGACTDNDNDGICAAQDCNDNDANFPMSAGTACNDGNANTENDVIQSDGCTCAGTPIVVGGDCADIIFSTGAGSITVSGLTTPITQLQIFDQNWATVLNCSGDNCGPTNILNNLSSGTYFVKSRLYSGSWQFICEKEEFVTVTQGGTGCTDNDNDGICANVDCDDNNANFPQAAGTSCNDGNANTENDVIQSDGCTCEGTPIGGNGGDCDNVLFGVQGNEISVSGLNTTPLSLLQVYNGSWQQVYRCSGDCDPSVVLQNMADDNYFVSVKLLTASWGEVCIKDAFITTGPNGGINRLDPRAFKVYPNPTDEEVFINLSEYEGLAGDILIQNSLGQIMAMKSRIESDEPIVRFRTEDFQAGLYFVTLQIKGRKLKSERLIIAR